MSAHPLGSATLSFGLVSVPIKMFSTGESSAAISFNWLHTKDGARLKQQYVCSKDGDKVEKDEMVKGYEFTKGQYVIFKPDALNPLDRRRADPEDRGQETGAAARRAAGGASGVGSLRTRQVRGQRTQTGARADSAQGRGQGDHRGAGRGAEDADHRPDGSAQGEPQGERDGWRAETGEAGRGQGVESGSRRQAQSGRCQGLGANRG